MEKTVTIELQEYEDMKNELKRYRKITEDKCHMLYINHFSIYNEPLKTYVFYSENDLFDNIKVYCNKETTAMEKQNKKAILYDKIKSNWWFKVFGRKYRAFLNRYLAG